ncbi:FAD/NAD(P)-binding oxidoreductase [Micromonospora sp. NBC_01796]|uniref:FAD/NAD(P)-binding oxidoreductase n=1 Tax=Micromonospora sp. NBC_01796 TaxID=2975987 RepID=UPI002DDB3FDE|nr:FAD/NAD(P)-binding oxidoreductase [Micromonospora sp. NBC_01796]WSA85855.1 NAD(P)/FAD-dependent oxidoreductase [Micromonospora sp. NBC_01796]
MVPTVVVVGGGYGGITVAKALDDVADVVLVEPRDTFVHTVAGLRAAVDPDWADRIFLPYDRLLTRGRVHRDRAVRVSATAVELGSGEVIGADYVVLATGVVYPYPARMDVEDSTSARSKLGATRDALHRARRVLLLGAGPVGLEFAGEIKSVWPGKTVTVVDPGTDLVSGRFPDEFRSILRTQLDQLGVEVLLGTSLRELPRSEPGRAATVTVTTGSGTEITADIWFPCYGVSTDTDYLDADLRAARRPDNLLVVTPELRLHGQDTVFAIGDVTAVPEMKMARAAQKHAEVVAANIRTLIGGGTDLTTYLPAADAIVLPLGPKGGVSYAPEVGVLGAGPTSDIKGDLFVDNYLELLGLTVTP